MSENNEKIQYFRTILLKVNQVFSWVYGEDFSLIESNCTWEMVLKNFFLLDSRERLLEIQEKAGTLPFHFTDGLSFTWIVVPFEKNFFVLGPTFSTDVSEQYFRKQMEIREMSIKTQIKFLKLMKNIPEVPLTTFGQLARMFYYKKKKKNIYFSPAMTKTSIFPVFRSSAPPVSCRRAFSSQGCSQQPRHLCAGTALSFPCRKRKYPL